MSTLQISKSLALDFYRFASEKGISMSVPVAQQLLTTLENKEVELLPYSLYASFYEYVLDQSGDKLIGLHVGEGFNMTALGIVGQLVQVSRNVGEALQNSLAYFELIGNVIRIRQQEKDGNLYLLFESHPEAQEKFSRVTQHLILSSMVFTWKEIHFLTLKQYLPVAVGLNMPSQTLEVFKRAFGIVPQFNSNQNFICFQKEVLALPILTADYKLMLSLSETACSRLSNDSPGPLLLRERIAQNIYRLMDPKFPSLSTLAANMGMSERSLQRQLRAEGVSYSELTNTIKKELALEYLQKQFSVKEISFLMGYSEATTFVAAFKKWYACTPGEFRKRKF